MLQNFKVDKLISCKAECISKIFLGTKKKKKALLILNKTAFEDEFTEIIKDNVIQKNDIYTNGVLEVKDKIKYTLIHPVPDSIIKKYTSGSAYMKKESAKLYREKVLPLALSMGPSQKWIDNIFAETEGKESPYVTETQENILHIDNDFVICLDLKWDRQNMDSLYILVLFKDASLYTIRELTAEHIPLLERTKIAIKKALDRYNVSMEEVKIYFHYYPTFYRLHLHVSALKTTWKGTEIGKSILLHDVIDNLSISSEYYREKEIELCISSSSYLYKAFLDS